MAPTLHGESVDAPTCTPGRGRRYPQVSPCNNSREPAATRPNCRSPMLQSPTAWPPCRMARMHNIMRRKVCPFRVQIQQGLSGIVHCDWAAGLAVSRVRCAPATLPAQRTLSTFSQAAGTRIRYFCLEFTKSVVPLLAAPTDVDAVDSAPW